MIRIVIVFIWYMSLITSILINTFWKCELKNYSNQIYTISNDIILYVYIYVQQ